MLLYQITSQITNGKHPYSGKHSVVFVCMKLPGGPQISCMLFHLLMYERITIITQMLSL